MSGRPRKGLGKADGFFDWTPVLADPGYDAPSPEVQPLDSDLDHARVSDRPKRNGLPEAPAYRWRPGEAQRDAEVAGRIAAARARALQRLGGSAQNTNPGGST